MSMPLKRTERHVHFISEFDLSRCYIFPEIDNIGDYACRYVTETPACIHSWQICNYLRILTCQWHFERTIGGIIAQLCLLLPVLAVYFTILALLAKHFLAPNLIVIGRSIHATGYGFGAIFVSALILSGSLIDIAAHCFHHTGHGSLLFTNNVGMAMNCYVAGMILLCRKGAYSCAPLHTFISLLVLYFGFMYVTMVFGFQDHHDKTHLYVHISFTSIVYVSYMFYLLWRACIQRGQGERFKCLTNHQISKNEQISEVTIAASDSSSASSRENVISRGMNIAWLINPKLHIKPTFLAVILSPVWFCLSILVPQVNDQRPLSGWCKYLCPCWFLLSPMLLFVFTTQVAVFFGLGCAFTLITLFFTKAKEQPRCLILFALYGVILGFICFKIFELESTALLFQMLSFLFNGSADIITLVAYPIPYIIMIYYLGSSLLNRGYADMVFGIVIGIPLCIPYFAFPMLSLQLCHYAFNAVTITANTLTSCIIYAILLSATIILLPTINFQLRHSCAYYFLILMIINWILLTLSQFSVIHPYGGLHAAVVKYVEHSKWA